MQSSIAIDCDKCTNKEKSIFCSIAEDVLSDISHKKTFNTYKKGHTLFHQGNPPYGLYCINNGKIKISKYGSDGKESIVRIAGPSDVLGHRSLFSNEQYSATATVIEEARVCFFDKNFIFKTLKTEPSMALNMIQKLSKEMGAAEARTASMFQKSVAERLAALFLTIMKSYGIQENGRCRLDIKLTREEIASLIGTANETVIRFITEFKERGIIEQEGKTLYIIDEQQLLDQANLNY